MPGLLSNLHAGTRALMAHSKGLEIAGKNVANVSNPGYARQRVILGDRVSLRNDIGTESSGLEARGLQQYRDRFLDRQILRETGMSAGLQARQQLLERAESALGQQIDRSADASTVNETAQTSGGGINEALSDLFASFDSLAARPTDAGEKQLLLQKAGLLVEKLNSADGRLAEIQTDAGDQVVGEVATVNGLLEDLAELNEEIDRAENGRPDSAVDLRDQRQAKLEELAKYIDFEAQPMPNHPGQIQVAAKDAGGADVILMERNYVRGPIAFDGTNFSGGSPAAALQFNSGSLTARVATRDGALQTLRDNLRSLGTQLTGAVNAAYNPTGATGNFFSTTPSGLIALDPTLTAATLKTTDTANNGANELALAVARIAETRFSSASGDAIDGTPGEFFARTVSTIGQQLATTAAQLDDQQLIQSSVAGQRDNVSGVSMDEELTDLMKFQRAFQASARFVNVVDELLELVVTRLGA